MTQTWKVSQERNSTKNNKYNKDKQIRQRIQNSTKNEEVDKKNLVKVEKPDSEPTR